MIRVERELRVVVIDDEVTERRRLMQYLEAAPGVEVIGVLSGDREAAEAVRRLAPDVIFVEVELRERTGFELVASLGPGAFSKAVFVTRVQEHAIRAFEVGALDYLIKPVLPERLQMALARSRAAIGSKPAPAKPPRPTVPSMRLAGAYLERFPVKEGGKVYFVKVSAIDWIQADENYVRIHVGNTSHLVRRTLTQVEAELDPAQFVRIHRSTIVNLERVREIQPELGRRRVVVLEDGGIPLRISGPYYQQLVRRAFAYRGRDLSQRGAHRP